MGSTPEDGEKTARPKRPPVRKRGQGEGSPRQRPDGRWEIRITLDGRRVSCYGRTKEEAWAAVDRRVAAHAEQLGPGADRETVASWLTRWLEVWVKPTAAPRTHELYTYHCAVHLIPALGDIKLKHLTAERVQRFIAAKGREARRGKGRTGTLSPTTVGHIRRTLMIAMNRAVKLRLVSRNVVADTDAPRAVEREVEPLTHAEWRAFLDAARGDRLEHLYVFTLATGLREGEILGLRWRDVDLEARTLAVRTQAQRVEGVLVLRDLKTPKSRATLHLPDGAVAALRAQRARLAEAKLRAGPLWAEHDLVFPASLGTIMDARNLRHNWHRLREAAGIRPARFYDLRHTCASFLWAEGVDMKAIQATLRHARLNITADVYTHLFEEARRDAADAMDRALARARTASR